MAAPSLPPPSPGWVDTMSRMIVQVGFPVFVAAVLLWWLLTSFEAALSLIAARMEHNATAVETVVTELKAQTQTMGEQLAILKQLQAQQQQKGSDR